MTTLADLRTRAYSRFDEQAQNFISKDEANALVNEGAAQLHNWLVTEGEAYVWQETVLPLVAKQSDYKLPDNLLKMLKVFSSNPTQPTCLKALPRIMPEEYMGFTAGNAWQGSYATPRAYMIVGQTLRLVPLPQTNPGSITYWWAPQYAPLVADADTTPLSMFVGADEFIVNQAVIGMKLKEESDTTALERRQLQIQQMIQQTVINRDMGRHAHVVDVERTKW